MIDNFYAIAGYVLCSKNRRLVLEALLAGPKTTAEIANEYDASKRSILYAINDLKNKELVTGSRQGYSITENGQEIITSINNRDV